jgi:predicted MFS family arabinose efflux permease
MRRLYLYKFLIDFWVIVPIIVPFYHQHGMNAMQILIVQAAFSLSQLIFEVPSGYLSDVIGRRRTLIAAALLMCCGIGIYACSGSFYWFILAETVLGIAGALRSGTDSALLYDFLKTVKDEHRYKIYEGRAEFWCRMGTAISSISGGLLGAYVTLKLPFYVNLGSAFLLALVGFSLREPYRERRPHGNPFKGIVRISLQSINQPELLSVMVRMALIFSTSVTAIWGYFLIYRQLNLPLWSHGIFFAVMQIICAMSARHSSRFEHMLGERNIRILLSGMGLLFIPIGLSNSPLMLLPFIFIHAAIWGMSTPYLLEKIQVLTGSDIRATTLSVGSMIGRTFAILWGPLFGWIIDHYSLSAAFIAMTGIFFIAPPLLMAASRIAGKMYNPRELG